MVPAKRLGVRWLAGNGADTALATDQRGNPPHGKGLSRKKAQKVQELKAFALSALFCGHPFCPRSCQSHSGPGFSTLRAGRKDWREPRHHPGAEHQPPRSSGPPPGAPGRRTPLSRGAGTLLLAGNVEGPLRQGQGPESQLQQGGAIPLRRIVLKCGRRRSPAQPGSWSLSSAMVSWLGVPSPTV